MSRGLEQLGQAVRKTQDEAIERSVDLDEVGARLFAAGSHAAQAPARPKRAVYAAVLAAAAAVMLIVGWRWLTPLTFEVDGARGAVAEHIGAPADKPVTLTFSDGTHVRLDGGSDARVLEVTRRGARIQIERGSAAVSVVHGVGGQWRFASGPFEVQVTGTRFDVSWDPATQRFALALHEGSVIVTGPEVERAVAAGEALELEVGARTAAAEPAPSSASPEPSAAEPAASEPDPSAAPSAGASGPSWQELAKAARYDEAWAAVEAIGFEALCERASPGELLALADVARYAGKGSRATHVYTTIRRRFPGSNEAALAAFTLGRMAFGGGAGYGAAIRWLNVYLQEAPNGPLAREALGRILEAHHQSNNRTAARATAKQYLAAYPNGPHAPLARSIVDSPKLSPSSKPR